MPESKDSDWDWTEFVARNNNELVATWGNLANRVLSFCYRNWEGRVPDVDLAALRPEDRSLLAAIDDGFNTVGGRVAGRASARRSPGSLAARFTGKSIS